MPDDVNSADPFHVKICCTGDPAFWCLAENSELYFSQGTQRVKKNTHKKTVGVQKNDTRSRHKNKLGGNTIILLRRLIPLILSYSSQSLDEFFVTFYFSALSFDCSSLMHL